MAIMMIPGLPEMVESTLPLYPGQERRVNDLAAGIFNSMLGCGQVMAPTFGSFSFAAYGFRTTTDIVTLISFVFALLYFVIANVPEAFKTTCRDRRVKRGDDAYDRLNDSVTSDSTNRSARSLKGK